MFKYVMCNIFLRDYFLNDIYSIEFPSPSLVSLAALALAVDLCQEFWLSGGFKQV